MNRKIVLVFLLAGWLLAACAGSATTSAPTNPPVSSEPRTLRVMTHDSFAVSEQVIAQFEADNNVKVQFLTSGDAGTMLNKAILSKDNPLADVLYGVDNTFLSRALQEDIFEAYHSPLLAQVPDEFQLDPEDRALPVDYGDVCLNYDIAYFVEKQPARRPPTWMTSISLSTRVCWRWRTRPLPHLGWHSCLQLSTTTVLMVTLPTGRSWSTMTCRVVSDWNAAYYTEFTRSGGTARSSSLMLPAHQSR